MFGSNLPHSRTTGAPACCETYAHPFLTQKHAVLYRHVACSIQGSFACRAFCLATNIPPTPNGRQCLPDRHLKRADSIRSYEHAFAYGRDAIDLCSAGIPVAVALVMLKLLGSYALAKLLGFGLIGAIVIYALLSMLT
jgi:hypothetical protein